ncbi:hypothetical protein G5V65_11500 [Rhodobacter sp. HX-7-19]|uniref:Uncharacterized protein n=1 Tax=Paragemmobacter kunshanensis TaxID=2583234 RepID=A0A6M1TZ54_9RHOB|nr:hypothetical protein [Rhodobacter kunshanensis]NGQ91522.1 hypothetical protein [Rhodobacter kunshanensis]
MDHPFPIMGDEGGQRRGGLAAALVAMRKMRGGEVPPRASDWQSGDQAEIDHL